MEVDDEEEEMGRVSRERRTSDPMEGRFSILGVLYPRDVSASWITHISGFVRDGEKR